MSKRVSIKNIARVADTSHSTVSRALRDSPLTSEEMREHVHLFAHEMGYTPNAVAQSLQTDRTDTVGLVVTSIADPFWAGVVKGVEEVAQSAGFSVFLNFSHNDPDRGDLIEDESAKNCVLSPKLVYRESMAPPLRRSRTCT